MSKLCASIGVVSSGICIVRNVRLMDLKQQSAIFSEKQSTVLNTFTFFSKTNMDKFNSTIIAIFYKTFGIFSSFAGRVAANSMKTTALHFGKCFL